MSRRFTYETCLAFGTDGEADFTEVDVTVSYECSFGCAAQTYGPAESCYPAEDPEVDDIRLEKVGGKPAPWNLHFHSDRHFAAIVVERLEASERDLEAMILEASETAADDHYAAQERRWEERRGEAA